MRESRSKHHSWRTEPAFTGNATAIFFGVIAPLRLLVNTRPFWGRLPVVLQISSCGVLVSVTQKATLAVCATFIVWCLDNGTIFVYNLGPQTGILASTRPKPASSLLESSCTRTKAELHGSLSVIE